MKRRASLFYFIVIFLLGGLVVASPASFGFSAKRQVAEAARPFDTTAAKPLWLSTVMDQNLTGLDFLSAEQRQELEKSARHYIADPAAMQLECANIDFQDPFCVLVGTASPEARKFVERRKIDSAKKKREIVRRVRELLKNGKLEELEAASESELRAGLRETHEFSELGAVREQLLADSAPCAFTKISFLVAEKAEEFLPELEVRQAAVALYQKTSSCENPYAYRAKYRSSLLRIWAGECSEAMSDLAELSAGKGDRDYDARALFWRAECERRLGKGNLFSRVKKNLEKKYPLSFHSLAIQEDVQSRIKSVFATVDSELRFRTDFKPALNQTVLVAEVLLQLGYVTAANKALTGIASQFEDAEPEFRLYVAYLLNRVGDYMGKFRVMSRLFEEFPDLLSRSSIALYYPRGVNLSTEAVRKVGLDELLILALIRQESAFNERARSPAGARGLMQVMPMTARLIEKRRVSSKDLFDPQVNMKIGTKYFASLLKRYDNDLVLALAAYNAGPKRVEEWSRRYPVGDPVLFMDLVPFRETREYVASIARNFVWYSFLYADVPAAAALPDGSEVIHGLPGLLKPIIKSSEG